MSDDPRWHFPLPEELIAQDPPQKRGDSRFLLVPPGRSPLGPLGFRNLPDFLRPGDLLVLNDSRVLPARLQARRADTGGAVEVLLIRPVQKNTWLAMARPGRRLREGVVLEVGGSALTVQEKRPDGQILVHGETDPATLAAAAGEMPLPPYIRRSGDDPQAAVRRERDQRRYQTVYNRADESGAGSVAAPTAGLHFSEGMLADLEDRGVGLARVRLHVGPGTFKPPTAEQMAAGRLHREFFRLSEEAACALAAARAAGGRVIAVGTTSLRVLETVARLDLDGRGKDVVDFAPTGADPDPFFTGRARRHAGHWEVEGMTRLFIQPPDRVTAADGLLTNFHLPGSSLLMLVAALAGEETWREAYRQAVESRMRFYSYGDCMLILDPLEGLLK